MYETVDFEFSKQEGAPSLKFATVLKLVTESHPEMPRDEKKQVARKIFNQETQSEFFVSPMFHVSKRLLEPDQHGFGPNTPTYLSIKRRDREPISDWRAMQKIKNAIVGDEWEAVEIYPAESRLVDTANQYHLFCWEAVFPIYLFNERAVWSADQAQEMNHKVGMSTKQR